MSQQQNMQGKNVNLTIVEDKITYEDIFHHHYVRQNENFDIMREREAYMTDFAKAYI